MSLTPNPLLRVRYAGKDFATAFDETVQRVQTVYPQAYNDFVTSSQGVMLMDLLSFIVDGLGFYIDRQGTDMYLSTSVLQAAVALLTRQIGYKMAPATSGSTNLTVGLPSGPYAFAVPLPTGFQFNGPNGLIFQSTQAYVFPPSTTTLTIAVQEGTTKTEIFNSNGQANQVFSLAQVGSGYFVAQGSVQVYVGGVLWTESMFITADQTNQYETNLLSSPPNIRFGDGVFGNIPANNAEVRVIYVACSGQAGQASSGSINSALSSLVVNFTTIPLTVTNPQKVGGASPPETVQHAQQLAPLYYAARNVLVTDEDYFALTNSFSDPLAGTIAKSRAVTVRSAAQDITLIVLLAQATNVAEFKVSDATAALTLIDTEADAILAQMATLTTLTTAILADTGTISTKVSDIITTQLPAITAAVASIKAHRTNILAMTGVIGINAISNESAAATILSQLNAIAAAVAAIEALPGTTQISDASVTAQLTNISTAVTSGIAQKTVINQGDAVITANVNSINVEANALADTDAGGTIAAAVTATAADASAVVTANQDIGGKTLLISQPVVGVNAVVTSAANTIVTQAAVAQAAVIDPTSSLATITAQIYSHVDGWLSSTCSANLVTVPILTRDVNGFLQAPSLALIAACQAFAETRVEATVTVEVVDGSPQLVFANMNVFVNVLPGFVPNDVIAAVTAVVQSLLIDNDYGEEVDLDDFYPKIGNAKNVVVPGVNRVNLSFTGAVDYQGNPLPGLIDQYGNMVPGDDQIVTQGTINYQQV